MGTEGYLVLVQLVPVVRLHLMELPQLQDKQQSRELQLGVVLQYPWGREGRHYPGASGATGGNFTLDASTFGGTIDIENVTASGSYVVCVGTNGDHSAGHVATQGAFNVIVDAQMLFRFRCSYYYFVTAGGN